MSAFEKQSILVVDDEAFSRGMVTQMLRRLGVGQIVGAEHGEQAIEILKTQPVTMVVTDFSMPKVHGLELLKSIRTGRTAAPRNLICAMLTGHAVRSLLGLAIVLDVDTFLAKPVSLETLVKHLNRCLQYRFEPLPVEDYEKVDVADADAIITGRGKPALPAKEESIFADTSTEEDLWVPDTLAKETAEEPAAPAKAAAPRPAAEKPAPSGKKAAPVKAAPVKAPSIEAKKPAAAAPAANKAMKAVPLSEVPEGAVLARNLTGSTGTLLLAAGTSFRARYARRLQELQDIEGEIKEIWIYEP